MGHTPISHGATAGRVKSTHHAYTRTTISRRRNITSVPGTQTCLVQREATDSDRRHCIALEWIAKALWIVAWPSTVPCIYSLYQNQVGDRYHFCEPDVKPDQQQQQVGDSGARCSLHAIHGQQLVTVVLSRERTWRVFLCGLNLHVWIRLPVMAMTVSAESVTDFSISEQPTKRRAGWSLLLLLFVRRWLRNNNNNEL